MARNFKYLADPLFLTSVTIYALNKWLLVGAEYWSGRFTDDYLNDLLLVPVMVPIILLASKKAGLRPNDSPPSLIEIALPIVIWAIAFELVSPLLFGRGTADPFDALAYLVGGLISWAVWNRWLSQSKTASPSG